MFSTHAVTHSTHISLVAIHSPVLPKRCLSRCPPLSPPALPTTGSKPQAITCCCMPTMPLWNPAANPITLSVRVAIPPQRLGGPCATCATTLARLSLAHHWSLVELTDCLGRWEASLGHVLSLALPGGSVYRLTVGETGDWQETDRGLAGD